MRCPGRPDLLIKLLVGTCRRATGPDDSCGHPVFFSDSGGRGRTVDYVAAAISLRPGLRRRSVPYRTVRSPQLALSCPIMTLPTSNGKKLRVTVTVLIPALNPDRSAAAARA
eukprot:756708-Hanusia_phi.AAC.1